VWHGDQLESLVLTRSNEIREIMKIYDPFYPGISHCQMNSLFNLKTELNKKKKLKMKTPTLKTLSFVLLALVSSVFFLTSTASANAAITTRLRNIQYTSPVRPGATAVITGQIVYGLDSSQLRPLANARIELRYGIQVLAAVTSDAYGSFRFNMIAPRPPCRCLWGWTLKLQYNGSSTYYPCAQNLTVYIDGR
jgi:hypothetical protein